MRSGRLRIVGAEGPYHDQVKRVILKKQHTLKTCYQGILKSTSLKGEIKVWFTIHETGRVSIQIKMRDEAGSPELQECVHRQLVRWIFPKPPEGEVMVNQTFKFSH